MPCENNQASMCGSPNELDHTAAAQVQQFRNAMMLQQAKEQIAKQRMNSIENASVSSLRGSFIKNISAQSAINKAHAFVAHSMPQYDGSQMLLSRDPSTFDHAKLQIARLNNDIAQCEGQLAILHNLKELKERRCRLVGGHGPHSFSPSFA
eukprot:CAMPEP_0183752172 /NCGR_PEP_ID=MMETSP0739-20130205/2194_1 /TAXON_ID=385413 /ORGANISM="Thalassiosira miniscula, Strain CCMP1093" /LENGTH=150 /DNA_ID=CAMNT_0025988497 /DNA_START=10 /DNA_END=462 /DNA_ORIENTATION=-